MYDLDTIYRRIVELKESSGHDLTVEEVQWLFDGEMLPEAVVEYLEEMSDLGYLFFDGEVVIILE